MGEQRGEARTLSARLVQAAALIAVASACAGPAPASDSTFPPGRTVPILGGGFVDDDGAPATDLSGIACAPQRRGRRVCLVIDDQGRRAQAAFLKKGALTAGRRIKLIGKTAAKTGPIAGQPPDGTRCPDNAPAFTNLDGEGVAYAAPYFYVIGSHGCSRRRGKFALSSFITARLRLDASGRLLDRQGRPVAEGDEDAEQGAIERTYRMADALHAAGPVKAAFGAPLASGDPATDGLTIEGVAVLNGVLYAGARAPVDGAAYLIGARAAALFAPGPAPLADPPTVVTLPLGAGAGVRDLAPLPGGALLILAGPASDDPATPFSLFIAHPPYAGTVAAALLGRLPDMPAPDGARAKPEAVLPLAPGALPALVLFDGLPGGGATEFSLPQPDGVTRAGK